MRAASSARARREMAEVGLRVCVWFSVKSKPGEEKEKRERERMYKCAREAVLYATARRLEEVRCFAQKKAYLKALHHFGFSLLY
jgi:hypothetical protein